MKIKPFKSHLRSLINKRDIFCLFLVPKSALSAVIISAILILFEFKIFKDLWQINKKELFPITVTIVVAFTVSVDIGILTGL